MELISRRRLAIGLFASVLLTCSIGAAQENLVTAYNTCVTDKFMVDMVFLGSRRALDQAEGACGDLINQAYATAERAGEPGRAILDRLARNQIQLEQRLLSMFPER